MNNYRKISFDIDFAGKKVLNTIQMPLEELTQNDFNSSLLTLKLMQGQELINLQGLSVVLNFLMPSGKDYVDTINAEMIDIENSIVSYSIPKDILSEVGMVVGTVSLYKEGYRYTSIVQFKFEVVSDFVEDGEIVESDNYPILAQMIGEVQNLKDEEMKRVESEIERIENEEERESSELQREMNEVERHEAENIRIINEQNREVKELERDQAERLREANSAKVKREEETRLEAETLRVQAESLRVGAESDRIQAESIRQMQESDRHEKELERQAAENLRVLAEIEREQKQNEFNARAEEVAVRIEEESQRISDLVEIEESKLVKSRDMVDYMGNQHNSLKEKADSDVDYAVKTAIGEFNYLDYEGQHITATNSIEGHARSAILKGQTLVNSRGNTVSSGGWSTTDSIEYIVEGANSFLNFECTLLPNTKYLTFFEFEGRGASIQFGTRPANGVWDSAHVVTTDGICKTVVTTGSDSKWLSFIVPSSSSVTDYVKISRIMIIPYQEGMENWDIPYFEGMQSVRTPVLTTTGKNLWDNEALKNCPIVAINNDGSLTLNGTMSQHWMFEYTVDSGTYSSSAVGNDSGYVHMFWRGGDDYFQTTKPVIISERATIKGYVAKGTYDNVNVKLQLEESSTPTPYEPYKSNILTTPEEVVLRSLPNGIKDTLNLNTREYVQHIKEVVLDGSYDENVAMAYVDDTTLVRFNINNVAGVQFGSVNKVLCSSLPYLFIHDLSGGSATVSQECISNHSQVENMITIIIKRSRLSSVDEEGFRAYLQSNPITIQYSIATPIVKTVDLSDNVVYSYDSTTHYSCSSEEGSLVPTLSVKVPTDVQEVISEQRKIISEQEEAQNILIDSQLSLYESISGVQTLQTDGEEVQMPQYIIDLYELAYKRGIRKKGER